MSAFGRFLIILAFAVGSAPPRPSGERPPALHVDFGAVGTDGMPVGDLQPSEVEIRLNGRLRKVRSLRRVETVRSPVSPGTTIRLPPPYGTNEGFTEGRSFVILVDEESLIGGREQPLRNAVEGLLGEFTPSDRAMVLALPTGGVRVAFTADRDRIRQALAGLSGQGSRSESGSELAFRTRRFLESLHGFLETQAGRSTPLTVLLFTAGLAAPRRDAPMTMAPGMNELLYDHFQHITVAAGAARAVFYIIHPADVEMRAAGWRENIAGVGFLGSDNPMEGIEHLAGATGAARLPLEATGTGSLLRVARETSAYYVAELEPERREIMGQSRPLSVRVGRPGIAVRARPAITFLEEERGKKAKLTIRDLLASGEVFTALALRAAGFTMRATGGRLRVGIMIEPVDPAVRLASAGAILVGTSGQVAAAWSAANAGARPLLGAMEVPAGTYRLRTAAVDSAGRPGVAEDVVEARLESVGPLSLGSLIFGTSRAEGMVPQLEFGPEATAIASFDIYGGAAGMGLSLALEVAREQDGPALLSVPLSLARADETRVVATGALPIGTLPPGDYVVRGIVRLEDGTTGRVLRTLRKASR